MALTVSCLAAAEPLEPVGYLRIVNAVAPGTGNVSVQVDGEAIYPKGYRFGAVTGGIGLSPGVHKVEVRREGVMTGKIDLTVAKLLTVTLVAHAEEIPTAVGKSARHQLSLMVLTPREVKTGKVVTFVSVSRTPLLRVDVRGVGGKWQAVEVPRLGTAESPVLLRRGYVALRSGGKALDALSVAEPGNYVTVLFNDVRDRLFAVSFRDSGELSGD